MKLTIANENRSEIQFFRDKTPSVVLTDKYFPRLTKNDNEKG